MLENRSTSGCREREGRRVGRVTRMSIIIGGGIEQGCRQIFPLVLQL